MVCKRCGRKRCLIDDLCDDCTLTLYGELFPWLEPLKAKAKKQLEASETKEGVRGDE